MAMITSAPGRVYSVGPTKTILLTFTAVSGDVSATVTVPGMSRVESVEVAGGLKLSAAPTFSGNVITLAFTDPAANAFGTLRVHGV